MRTLSQQPPLFQRGAQAQARKKKPLQRVAFQFLVGPRGVEPRTNGL